MRGRKVGKYGIIVSARGGGWGLGLTKVFTDTLKKLMLKVEVKTVNQKREKMRGKYIIQAKNRETGEDILIFY